MGKEERVRKTDMDIFEALRTGREVDMYSDVYRPCIEELHRANRALFHLNHAEPQTEAWQTAFEELFDGYPPQIGIFTPVQIDSNCICSVLRTEQIPRGVPVPPANPPGEERSPGKGNPFPES